MTAVRVALVTGGRGTVGTLVTQRLLTDGFRVTTVGRRASEPLSSGHKHLVADLAVDDAVPLITAQLPAAPDVFVSLAAPPSAGQLTDMTPRQLHEVMMVKVWTPGRLAAALCPEMASRGWGRVVLTGGITSRHPLPGYVAGAVSNASVAVLAEALARQWHGSGITVNCVTPGAMASPRFATARELLEGSPGFDAGTPVLRPGALADVILFLTSSQADGICGTDVVVDGGALVGRSI